MKQIMQKLFNVKKRMIMLSSRHIFGNLNNIISAITLNVTLLYIQNLIILLLKKSLNFMSYYLS